MPIYRLDYAALPRVRDGSESGFADMMNAKQLPMLDDIRDESAEDIRVGLGIPNSILVMPCIAHDRNAVKDVVVQLLYQIMG